MRNTERKGPHHEQDYCPRSSSNRELCDVQWLDSVNLPLGGSSRFPKVQRALGIEPEFRRITEQPREAEGHFRADSPPLAKQLVDCLARDPQCFSKGRDRQAEVRHEVLTKHLARMRRTNLPLSNVHNAHATPRLNGSRSVPHRKHHRRRTESRCATDR